MVLIAQGRIQDFWKEVLMYKGGGGRAVVCDFTKFFLNIPMKINLVPKEGSSKPPQDPPLSHMHSHR